MKHIEKSKSPAYGVYVVEGDGDKAIWTRIGAAWNHSDGEGFNLTLTALPITGRLTIRKLRNEREAA